MKIDSIEACTCVLPVQGGIAIATRSLTERQYMLVRVRTDTGIDGLGLCYVGKRAGSIATFGTLCTGNLSFRDGGDRCLGQSVQ